MKKITGFFAVLLSLVLLLSSLPVAASAAAPLKITIDAGSFVEGENIVITLSLENNPGIIAAMIAPILPEHMTIVSMTNYEKNLRFSYTDVFILEGKTAYTSDGPILKLVCSMPDEYRKNGTKVTFRILEIIDADYNTVVSEVNCEDTVNFPGEPEVVPGDVTGNGVIDIMDLLRLQKYISGSSVMINLANADVNGSGNIDIFDLIRLKKMISG